MTTSPQSPHAPISAACRSLIQVGIGCGLVVMLVNTWLVSGLFAPLVVDSGSMAPGLRGPHRLWTCDGCQREFVCGLESLPAAGHPAVCPWCGAANPPQAGVDRSGDRVLVDRSAFLWRRPRRWEAVVLECPDAPGRLCVKRVVGLPGERVRIRDGDVIVDGQVARKTLAVERALAVLVHDASHGGQTSPPNSTRWRDASGQWRREGGRFVHPARARAVFQPAAERPEAPIDWLVYHSPARGRSPGESADGPILDESVYYQAESRVLNPLRDLLLCCQVACRGPGQFQLRAQTGGDAFHVAIDVASGEGTLVHNDRVVGQFNAAAIPSGRAIRLDWMLADQQVQLALGNRVLVDYGYEAAGNAAAVPDVAIGAGGAEVSLGQLQLWRDVYYTPGPSPARQLEYRLGSDEYFLLGDHSAHSEDSRWWRSSGVAARCIIGRAISW